MKRNILLIIISGLIIMSLSGCEKNTAKNTEKAETQSTSVTSSMTTETAESSSITISTKQTESYGTVRKENNGYKGKHFCNFNSNRNSYKSKFNKESC